jgi:hypothetical protein
MIMDTTLSGVSSEIVKAISKALQIPTYSASYGHDNDIMYVFFDKQLKKNNFMFSSRKNEIKVNRKLDFLPLVQSLHGGTQAAI